MEERKKGRNKNRHCGFFTCHGPLILLIIPRRLYYFHCIVRKWKFKEVKSPAQVHSETKQHPTKICLVLKVMYFPPNCTVPCSKGNIRVSNCMHQVFFFPLILGAFSQMPRCLPCCSDPKLSHPGMHVFASALHSLSFLLYFQLSLLSLKCTVRRQ